MRKSIILKQIISVLCILFTYIFINVYANECNNCNSVSASEIDKKMILSFQNEYQPLDSLYYFYQNKPALDELLDEMPDKLTVLTNNSELIDVPVSWYCAGDDYENSNYYYYQFNPQWNKKEYLSIDGLEIPYIGVFLVSSEETVYSVTGNSNETQVYNFLTETLGLNTATAVGIMANIQKESSFNPRSQCIDTNGKTSYGICQWNGGRFDALRNYCSRNGYDYTSVTGQLKYLQYELSNGEKNAWNKMQGIANTATGAYTAGYKWAQYFERCAQYYNGVNQYETRGNLAKNTYWPEYQSSSSSPEITISGASKPYTMVTGDSFTVTGQIASGLSLTNVTVGCYNASGSLVTGKSVNPNSKSYNIRNLDSYVTFNMLSAGVYKYKVTASNSDRTETLIEKSFIVLGNSETIADGTYTIGCAQNTAYLITAAGGNAQLNRDSYKQEQTWYISYVRDGYYTIRNYYTGLYLDVYNAGSSEGTNVWQHEGNNSTAQYWQILPAGGGSYCLIPQCAADRCIDAVGGTASDGVNLAIYAPHMGGNQRFVFTQTNCNFTDGNKIIFDANGGTLPAAYATYTANGVNKVRGLGELIIYNVPNLLLNTNEYGNEAVVSNTGLVTGYRSYGNLSHLTVPWGGYVISGHLNGVTDGASFVDKIRSGYYVGIDYSTRKVSVYTSIDGYLANHKYVKSGTAYGSMPTPTRSGYSFDGWYTSAAGGTKVIGSSTYSASRLYAHWSTIDTNVVKITSATFPDATFRTYVSDSFDKDGNGYLSESEIRAVADISVGSKNIYSLQGIEYFGELTFLDCHSNNLTGIDLSCNTKLENLWCHKNQLRSLDVSKNTKLKNLICHWNQLTSLDLRNNTQLGSVSPIWSEFNLGVITDTYSLSNLIQYGFDSSKASNWNGATYDSATNSLKDFTSTSITYTYVCGGSNVKSVEFSLTAERIPENKKIDVNTVNFPDSVFRNYVLNEIDRDGDKKLSKTEIENTTSIILDKKISGGAENLTGIQYFTELADLDCSFNSITALDLSKNTKLQRLSCGSNRLTELDVSSNRELTYLNCMENQLKYVDVSSNRKLVEFDCDYNQIQALDLSLNSELETLYCYRNNLKEIDLTYNTKLKDLNIHSNQLTSLDLSNTQVKSVIATGNKFDIGAVSEYALSNLSKYGFKLGRASNWQNASYDKRAGTIVNLTSSEIKYDYDCGNGVTVRFSLYCSLTQLTDYSTNVSIAAASGFGYSSLFGAELVGNTSVVAGMTSVESYEMTLTNDNATINTQGIMTVSIPVPSGYNGTSLKVYRKESNGSLTDMKAVYKIKTDTLDFETNTLGTYIVASSSVKKGDLNGDGLVNNKDLTLLRRALANGNTSEYIVNGDMNSDSVINNKDLTLLRRILAGA
ncbi:MAG: phage tail tip lysozyme [Ruminococcus flavefaciens]|nr:phage tail tip lysozyme [Ruminococcus flavefaciens]